MFPLAIATRAFLPPAAFAGSEQVITVVSENFDAIFTVIGLILAALSVPVGAIWMRSRKVARELLNLIDSEPRVSNEKFKERAENLGLQLAAKRIAKLS